MLYYKFSGYTGYNVKGVLVGQWHVGETTVEINDYTKSCVFIQADGDELEAIRSQFSNVPIPNKKRVVRWKGAMAEFIALNIS
jgi:hypothetical protein